MENKKTQQNTQNKTEIRSVTLDFNPPTDSESRVVEGYASVFSDDYTCIYDGWGEKFYEKVERGSFINTLADKTKEVFMLMDHDYKRVVGRSGVNLELTEDEKGLFIRCELPKTTEGNDLLEMVRTKLISGMSFGFRIVRDKVRWDDDWNMYRDIKEVELFEVTATTQPCYSDTELNIGESRSKIKNTNTEENLKPKDIENTEGEERSKNSKVNTDNANMLLSCLSAFMKK